jgi:hypothetical protein
MQLLAPYWPPHQKFGVGDLVVLNDPEVLAVYRNAAHAALAAVHSSSLKPANRLLQPQQLGVNLSQTRIFPVVSNWTANFIGFGFEPGMMFNHDFLLFTCQRISPIRASPN